MEIRQHRLQGAEAEAGTEQSGVECWDQLAHIADIKQLDAVARSMLVFLKLGDRAERLVSDARIATMLKENLDPLALLAEGLAESAARENAP